MAAPIGQNLTCEHCGGDQFTPARSLRLVHLEGDTRLMRYWISSPENANHLTCFGCGERYEWSATDQKYLRLPRACQS